MVTLNCDEQSSSDGGRFCKKSYLDETKALLRASAFNVIDNWCI